MTGSAILDRRQGDWTPSGDLPVFPDELAVFLDVDGTLVDIAPTPDGIVVPYGLSDELAILRDRLGGALALVSGRELDYLRALFPGLSCYMAGLHGAEIGLADGTYVALQRSPELDTAKADLALAASAWPGVGVEDKGAAFAAHYRLAPQFEAAVEGKMRELALQLGEAMMLQRGKCVIEIRPAGQDKGTALTAMMAEFPFAGRRPVAVGDDLTDEAMFAACERLGGLSVKVGPGRTRAQQRLASPSEVRNWIRSLAS